MRYDSTPAVYLLKMFDVLDELHIDTGDLQEHVGTARSELQGRDRSIALARYIGAIEFAMDRFRIADLGFLVGEHTSMLEHGVLGYALLSSPNLRVSLQRYVRYQYLQGPLLSIRLEIDGSLAALVANPMGRRKLSPAVHQYLVQEWLVGWNQWCRLIGRSGNFFEHVRLSFPTPNERRYYSDHLGCTVSYGNAETTAFFPAGWLQLPLEYADETIAALCAVQCERLLEILELRSGLTADIHRQLANSPGDIATMDKMARMLQVGVRTLRRRLTDEGTTYQAIVLEFRIAMAKRYLLETTLPANEVAALIGYSDPANLYRVFQYATGLTPAIFRKTYSTKSR